MARRGGLNGVVLADVTTTGAGTLTTISYVTKWSVSMTRDKIDVTALGDTSKVKVTGLPDQSVQLDGFSDLSANVLSRLTDGVARGLKIIPDNTNHTAVYFSGGTYIFDGTVNAGVGEAVAFSMTADAFSSGAWTTGI